MYLNMVIFGLLGLVFLGVAIGSAWQQWWKGIIGYFALAFFFGFIAINSAIDIIGYGHVTENAEPFTKRLYTGVQYQVLGSIKEGGSEVLFVKPHGGGIAPSELYAIRVKEGEAPPEHFALLFDGKPVAVVVDKATK